METINKEDRRSTIISEITCMCTNVRSIMNEGKREELQNLLFEKGIAILPFCLLFIILLTFVHIHLISKKSYSYLLCL